VLLEVGEICEDCLGRVFGLKRVQELLLDVVPDGEVDVVVPEGFPPDDGAVPEAQLELSNLLGFIPLGNSGSIFNSVNENPGKYGIFFASSVEKRNVRRMSHTVMVVEGLGNVGHVEVGSGGEGLAVSS